MNNPHKYIPKPPAYNAINSTRRGSYTNLLLTKWVLTQNPSIEAAALKIGISYITLENAMCGYGLRTATVDKILRATGYTYEELFLPYTTVQEAK